jgi:hypothetical protein
MIRILVFFTVVAVIFSQGYKGSKGLFLTQSSQTINPGQVNLFSGSNFFTGLTPVKKTGSVEPVNVNAWQVDIDFGMTYGITENIDFSFATRLYQDTQFESNNIPSNISVTGKYGNIELIGRSLTMSAQLDLLYGLANHNNIAFEDYFGNGLGFHPNLTFSYYFDQYLPDNATSFHSTIGYKVFFDSGEFIEPDPSKKGTPNTFNTSNSALLTWSFGTMIPFEKLDFFIELDSYFFLNKPPELVMGNDDRMNLNVASRFRAQEWFSLEAGMSLTIHDSGAETSTLSYANYASWRGFIATNFTILQPGNYGLSSSEVERNEYRRKIQTFKGLLEEQDNTEKIQDELEKLREEREKAEKELEELKKILED